MNILLYCSLANASVLNLVIMFLEGMNGSEDHLVRPTEDTATRKHRKKKEKHHGQLETKTEEILEGKIDEIHTVSG